jgi:hypothetical protein
MNLWRLSHPSRLCECREFCKCRSPAGLVVGGRQARWQNTQTVRRGFMFGTVSFWISFWRRNAIKPWGRACLRIPPSVGLWQRHVLQCWRVD